MRLHPSAVRIFCSGLLLEGFFFTLAAFCTERGPFLLKNREIMALPSFLCGQDASLLDLNLPDSPYVVNLKIEFNGCHKTEIFQKVV